MNQSYIKMVCIESECGNLANNEILFLMRIILYQFFPSVAEPHIP